MYYEAIDRWNSLELFHYGVKGMKWGHRKVVDSMFDPRYRGRRYSSFDGSIAKKSKRSNLSRGLKIAAGVGGALAAYTIAKKIAYSGSGIEDPKILSNYIKANKSLAKATIGKIAPSLANATVSGIKKAIPKTIPFLKKTGKVVATKVVPSITRPYTKAGSRFTSALIHRTKKDGFRFAKQIAKATTVKRVSTDIDMQFAKKYINGLSNMPNRNRRLERANRKETRKMDRREWLLGL